MDIKKSITRSLKKEGINQMQLAERMGIAQATISLTLRRGSCNTDTLARLAEAFNIKVSTLIARGEQ